MKWSAIVTTYNSAGVIGRALESLVSLPADEAPQEIIVVDNASSDNTLKVVESFGHSIRLFRNQRNMGLARANNTAARNARSDSLFFLNPDVEVLPGAPSALHRFQQNHPNAALIGPAMVDENGLRQPTARTWPSLLTIASRRTLLAKTDMGRRIAHRHLNRFNSAQTPVMANWLVGAALWLTPFGRKRAGLMSEKYFLYFEDVEWCWRAWAQGTEVWFEPASVIRHVCNRQSASDKKTLKHHLKSMLFFILTHPSVIAGAGPGVKK